MSVMRDTILWLLAIIAAFIGFRRFGRKAPSLESDVNRAVIHRRESNIAADLAAEKITAEARAEATGEIDESINNGANLGTVLDSLDE